MSSRITALWCWYHGGPFRGYQTQPEGPTVQGALDAALRTCGIEAGTIASGRTDLGVHARMQVVSFASDQDAPGALAGSLPSGMGIAAAVRAPPKFNAHWSCTGKQYRYRLLLADDAAWAPFAWRVDVAPSAVEAVLAHAIGTHDFWAFHEKSSARKPRTVSRLEVRVDGVRADVRITGSGFGRYQVRYLVGGAVGVARGQLRRDDYVAGIERAVAFAGVKAPAQGLTLWEATYPDDPFAGVRPVLPAGPPFAD